MRTSPWDWQGEFVTAIIQDVGNGWYRCMLSHNGFSTSMNAKMADKSTPQVCMNLDDGYAYFDLETGDVHAGRGMLSAWEGPPHVDIRPHPYWVEAEVYIHGLQLEGAMI